METNIVKLKELYGVQMHTAEKVIKLFDFYLPHGYANTAKEKLSENNRNVSSTYIRQVKTLQKTDLQILNCLIEIAQKQKAVAEAEKAKLKELTS